MLNFNLIDDACSKRRRVAQAKQKSKGQILYILMTKCVKCFILKLQ